MSNSPTIRPVTAVDYEQWLLFSVEHETKINAINEINVFSGNSWQSPTGTQGYRYYEDGVP
jgi:hypothetical protein